jgi:hypothetical protein
MDETKPNTSKSPPGERLEFDEDEDNPLGSDENAGGVEVSPTEQVPGTSSEKLVATSSDDTCVPSNDERSENNEQTEIKENVAEQGPDEEGDDFEGGLC